MSFRPQTALFGSGTLITTAAAAAVISGVIAAYAAPAPVPAGFTAEKCYGIAKAGKNDCASAGNNSCGGLSRVDSDSKAWLYLPAGACEKIVGASLAAR